jgi:hypothetical protein
VPSLIPNKKKPKRILIFSILIIATLFIGITVYSYYYGLTEIDLFSANLSFECPDQEILLSGQKIQSPILGSGLTALVQEDFLRDHAFTISLLEPSPQAINPTLRC